MNESLPLYGPCDMRTVCPISSLSLPAPPLPLPRPIGCWTAIIQKFRNFEHWIYDTWSSNHSYTRVSVFILYLYCIVLYCIISYCNISHHLALHVNSGPTSTTWMRRTTDSWRHWSKTTSKTLVYRLQTEQRNISTGKLKENTWTDKINNEINDNKFTTNNFQHL